MSAPSHPPFPFQLFERTVRQFNTMYKKGVYISNFQSQPMFADSLDEFVDARCNRFSITHPTLPPAHCVALCLRASVAPSTPSPPPTHMLVFLKACGTESGAR
jgi:hypothetical protein